MKSTLAILFNQDFSKNIHLLDRIYNERFSEIVYLVPDHFSKLHNAYVNSNLPQSTVFGLDLFIGKMRRAAGKRNRAEISLRDQDRFRQQIIRVIGHQFFFYHFVFQAAPRLLASEHDWFWVCGDDAMLSPAINESSIWDWVGGENHVEAVICQPVIGSDAWIRKIGKSVVELNGRLSTALGSAAPWRGQFSLSHDEGVVENSDIAVGCADFFGISRNALIRTLPYLKTCFANKVYVEVALPNAIMRATSNVRFVSNFNWQRVSADEERERLIQLFLEDEENVFTHPIKLAMCSDNELARLGVSTL